MSTPSLEFLRVVNALTVLKVRSPHMRIGQILEIAVGKDLFYTGDEELAEILESLVRGEQ